MRRKRVSKACSSCRKLHLSCDENRPCSRCIQTGNVAHCVDVEPQSTNKKMKGKNFIIYRFKNNDSPILSAAPGTSPPKLQLDLPVCTPAAASVDTPTTTSVAFSESDSPPLQMKTPLPLSLTNSNHNSNNCLLLDNQHEEGDADSLDEEIAVHIDVHRNLLAKLVAENDLFRRYTEDLQKTYKFIPEQIFYYYVPQFKNSASTHSPTAIDSSGVPSLGTRTETEAALCIWQCYPKRKLLMFNDTLCTTLGYDRNELTKIDGCSIVHEDDYRLNRILYRSGVAFRTSGEYHRVTSNIRILNGTGSFLPATLTAFPVDFTNSELQEDSRGTFYFIVQISAA